MTRHGILVLLVLIAVSASWAGLACAEIRVSAFTAYLDPDARGARVSVRSGITAWVDPDLKVVWFGQIKTPGKLNCKVSMRIGPDVTSRLRLTIAEQSHEATTTGSDVEKVAAVDFGTFEVRRAGYLQFVLESLNEPGVPFGDLDALELDGPATADAHFNLRPCRNAASVHLTYRVPKESNTGAFYCEVTAVEDPIWTFYMACGWHRGYFGMQVNSPDERRIIFSVWDSGGESRDRRKVVDENRVELVAKGEGVHTNAFGGEGTGGHSHLVYRWKTDERQKFLVTAEPVDASHSIYSGFFFVPDKKQWMLISSWRAPKEGGYL